MPTIANFTVPRTPPSLNVIKNWHWSKWQKEHEAWRLFCMGAWMYLGKPKYDGSYVLSVVVRHKSKRKRDLDNTIAGMKFLIDSLRHVGFVKADDSAYLRKIDVEFQDGKKDETEVSIQSYIGESA